MKKIELTKKAVGIIVGIGTGAIVSNIIRLSSVIPGGILIKGCVWIAGFGITCAVTAAAKHQTDEMIDEAVVAVTEIVHEVEIAQAKARG